MIHNFIHDALDYIFIMTLQFLAEMTKVISGASTGEQVARWTFIGIQLYSRTKVSQCLPLQTQGMRAVSRGWSPVTALLMIINLLTLAQRIDMNQNLEIFSDQTTLTLLRWFTRRYHRRKLDLLTKLRKPSTTSGICSRQKARGITIQCGRSQR